MPKALRRDPASLLPVERHPGGLETRDLAGETGDVVMRAKAPVGARQYLFRKVREADAELEDALTQMRAERDGDDADVVQRSPEFVAGAGIVTTDLSGPTSHRRTHEHHSKARLQVVGQYGHGKSTRRHRIAVLTCRRGASDLGMTPHEQLALLLCAHLYERVRPMFVTRRKFIHRVAVRAVEDEVVERWLRVAVHDEPCGVRCSPCEEALVVALEASHLDGNPSPVAR